MTDHDIEQIRVLIRGELHAEFDRRFHDINVSMHDTGVNTKKCCGVAWMISTCAPLSAATDGRRIPRLLRAQPSKHQKSCCIYYNLDR